MLMMSAPVIRREPAIEEQRLDTRLAATERAIERVGVLRSAARKNHVAKARPFSRVSPPRSREPGERIVIEHLGPQIRVVAGPIAAVPDVREVGRAVARRHSARRRDSAQRLDLELVDVPRRRTRRKRVPRHVEQAPPDIR